MIFNAMTHAIHDKLQKIYQHPFNLALSDGTLPQEKFIFYLKQDALYLAEFSKALAITAGRLPNDTHARQFMQFALDAVQAEQALHEDYLNQYQQVDLEVTQTPAGFMYTNYLLRTVSLSSVEEAVASVLPCFYIYNEVGKQMLAGLYPDHPYHDWIALYGGEAFEASVQSVIDITNALGEAASKTTQDNMVAAFVKSTQLEWLFWDNAYHQTAWAI
jgi:thiaminase (transcriptional activator TenA)